MPERDYTVGQTRDVGFQVGVRRTLDAQCGRVWALMVSPAGVRIWLADLAALELRAGASYLAADGTCGVVRVVSPGSHLRVTWQPGGWPRPSLIQVRLASRGERCELAFHQEHLPGPAEREQRRRFFGGALDQIAAALQSGGR